MEKTRIAIIIEVKQRELPFFCILQDILQKEGYKVQLIPFRSLCTWRLLKFRPNIIMVNGIRHTDPYFYNQIALPKKMFNAKVVCYYSEQIGYYDKSLADGYKNQLVFDNVDFHVAWGPRFCRDLESVGVSHEKLWYIGSLQYDIDTYIKHSNIEIKNQLASKFNIDRSKKWILYADNIIKVNQPKNLYDKRRYDSFSVVKKTAELCNDSIIIFRTHPETSLEEIDYIKSYFKGNNNVIFNNEGHVFYWTLAIDATIIWCSTSSLQAMFLNKPNFGFMTSDKLNQERYWYKGILPLYDDYDKLAADVRATFDGVETDAEKETEKKRSAYVDEWYHVKDGLAFNRLVALFDVVNKSSFIQLAPNKLSYFKIAKILYYELQAYIGDLVKGRDKIRNVHQSEILEELKKYDTEKYQYVEFEIKETESGKYFKQCQVQ